MVHQNSCLGDHAPTVRQIIKEIMFYPFFLYFCESCSKVCQLLLYFSKLVFIDIFDCKLLVFSLPDGKEFNTDEQSHALAMISINFLFKLLLKHFHHFLFHNIAADLTNPSLLSLHRKVLFNYFLSSFSKFVPFVHVCDM